VPRGNFFEELVLISCAAADPVEDAGAIEDAEAVEDADAVEDVGTVEDTIEETDGGGVILGGGSEVVILGGGSEVVILGGGLEVVIIGGGSKVVILGGGSEVVILGGGLEVVIIGGPSPSPVIIPGAGSPSGGGGFIVEQELPNKVLVTVAKPSEIMVATTKSGTVSMNEARMVN
jgi:hypothetical protein